METISESEGCMSKLQLLVASVTLVALIGVPLIVIAVVELIRRAVARDWS
jgi:hypothetical protein